uniref:Uncharacterized protein n=1 Tax=Chromera velia CCMP2878 TaxID=1169474 RepID=A0A0G4FR79_9ALVE|eukprot:Cvel_18350.t1-p1 / transcript=Cvel_18350.t1 / gene=Cvel_18350 / organism=Chromera_velia_CCMP2878 / gene_product=hypothetical protein / transcript_product=hypothetical protein / location=Cvel_scaffold1516:17195-18073(-) / protein_length=293 / sequence_SO=supercontig / SO=protein_coding / is_pseudo=false
MWHQAEQSVSTGGGASLSLGLSARTVGSLPAEGTLEGKGGCVNSLESQLWGGEEGEGRSSNQGGGGAASSSSSSSSYDPQRKRGRQEDSSADSGEGTEEVGDLSCSAGLHKKSREDSQDGEGDGEGGVGGAEGDDTGIGGSFGDVVMGGGAGGGVGEKEAYRSNGRSDPQQTENGRDSHRQPPSAPLPSPTRDRQTGASFCDPPPPLPLNPPPRKRGRKSPFPPQCPLEPGPPLAVLLSRKRQKRRPRNTERQRHPGKVAREGRERQSLPLTQRRQSQASGRSGRLRTRGLLP